MSVQAKSHGPATAKSWRSLIPMRIRIGVGFWLYRTFILPGEMMQVRTPVTQVMPDDRDIIEVAEQIKARRFLASRAGRD